MPVRVLLADDSVSIRKLVEFTLKSKGFLVSSVEDGLAAFELLAKDPFDVIVLDINMPHMDGFELLKRIKADEAYASIPVIMLTTESQDEDRLKAADLGATAYLVKPFKPTQLLVLVERMTSKG